MVMVMEDGSVTNIYSWEVHSCILFQCVAHGEFTNIFKHGQYSNRSNAFIQHGRFDLLLYTSW